MVLPWSCSYRVIVAVVLPGCHSNIKKMAWGKHHIAKAKVSLQPGQGMTVLQSQ